PRRCGGQGPTRLRARADAGALLADERRPRDVQIPSAEIEVAAVGVADFQIAEALVDLAAGHGHRPVSAGIVPQDDPAGLADQAIGYVQRAVAVVADDEIVIDL